MDIINLTKAHAQICLDIDKQSFPDEVFSLPLLSSMLDSPNLLGILIAEKNAPAGYALVSVIGSEAELLSIAVLPKFQGKGAGKQMMVHIIKTLKKTVVKNIFLEVRKSNNPAIKMYESFGGVQVGERKGYYKTPKEDALVYKLEI